MEYLYDLLVNLHWGAVGQIIMIDILLGGDNAVVIGMACRNLPPEQRTKGVIWGTAGAILLRVILIVFAVMLLDLPFLKVAGGVLLLWIGAKLLLPDDGSHDNIEGSSRLSGAIKTIIVADLVMSFDNVIAPDSACHLRSCSFCAIHHLWLASRNAPYGPLPTRDLFRCWSVRVDCRWNGSL